MLDEGLSRLQKFDHVETPESSKTTYTSKVYCAELVVNIHQEEDNSRLIQHQIGVI